MRERAILDCHTRLLARHCRSGTHAAPASTLEQAPRDIETRASATYDVCVCFTGILKALLEVRKKGGVSSSKHEIGFNGEVRRDTGDVAGFSAIVAISG